MPSWSKVHDKDSKGDRIMDNEVRSSVKRWNNLQVLHQQKFTAKTSVVIRQIA